MISIAEILHIQTDSLLPILLFEASDSGILAVILLGHFHDIHQSAGEIVSEIAEGIRLTREFTALVSVPERERNMVMVP